MKICTGYVVAVCSLGCAAPAFAQAQSDLAASMPGGGLEEIVVTAQKRAENLQNTPISIVAITANDLEVNGIHDINDLQSEVPNLQVGSHPNASSTVTAFIRGIGNYDDQITQDPSVAIYMDGVYIARSQGLAAEVADLERIEVLRGPQGSLYGRNATGGAINYVTRAPEFDEFSLSQSLTYGNYGQFRSRTRVNIPIGDTLAAEFGYLHSQKNGFVKNPGTGVERWGDKRRDAYRAALHWRPADAIDVRYAYDRSDIRDTPAFMVRAPFYPAKAERPSAGSPFVRDLRRNDVTAQGHNLTVNWDVSDGLTLKSITGYRRLSSDTNQNYLTGEVGPVPLILTGFEQHQKQFSQELQAIGKAMSGRLEYVIGAYYFDESADSFDITQFVGNPSVHRLVTIKNSAYAFYGQATIRPAFLEGLYVTPSLRWSRDKRQATLEQTVVPAVGTPTFRPAGKGKNSFSNVSPGLVIGYQVTDDINVYAKWARGYKSGGYNVRASTIARFEAGFDPETLDSYELGLKSSWFDDRLRFNLAGFVAKYKNIQFNLQVDPGNPSVTDVLNAGRATIKGIELDLKARPVPGLTLGASYGYLDAQFDEIIDPITGANIADRFDFVQAPHHSFAANLEYQFPETSIGTFTAYVDYYLQDKMPTSANDPRFISRGYGLLGARLTLSDIPVGLGSWRLSVFGKNLTDTKYYVSHFNAGLPAAIFGEPRSYGVELTFEY